MTGQVSQGLAMGSKSGYVDLAIGFKALLTVQGAQVWFPFTIATVF